MGHETSEAGLLEGVVTFEGTIQALRAEKRFKREGISCRLVPTPRELSSTCALALSFRLVDRDAVSALLRANHLRFEAVHLYPEQGGDPVPWHP
jgi:hypothetical protein